MIISPIPRHSRADTSPFEGSPIFSYRKDAVPNNLSTDSEQISRPPSEEKKVHAVSIRCEAADAPKPPRLGIADEFLTSKAMFSVKTGEHCIAELPSISSLQFISS